MANAMKYPGLLIIGLLVICGVVSGIPTTLPATLVGNLNVTFNGNGIVGTAGWFVWGMASGNSWSSLPNVTPVAGVISYTMKGTPVFGSTQYWYRACDTSGCGAELSLTTTAVTPIPNPGFDVYASNITENGFDLPNVFWNSLRVYTAVTGETIFYGLIFALVFIGMWLRTRGTQTATIFGMICLSLFTVGAGGLAIGLPPEFIAVGQALMYLSLTGAFLAFTFK